MCLLVLCFQQNCQKSVGTGRTRIKFNKFFVDILYQLQKFTYTPRSLAYCWVLYLSWKWKSWSGDFERVGKYHLEVTLRREEGTGSWYQILKKAKYWGMCSLQESLTEESQCQFMQWERSNSNHHREFCKMEPQYTFKRTFVKKQNYTQYL